MKYHRNGNEERIGFDFYCDIANNIVKARQEKNWTQKDLSKSSGIKITRLANIEAMRTRIDLDDLNKLSKALERTVDWLINAELDSRGEECLYLVWTENHEDFSLYMRATSRRMAAMKFDKLLKESCVKYDSPRQRLFAELVGVPVTQKEIQNRFKRRTEEELVLEPD